MTMTPYYQRGTVVLYRGDCRELLPVLLPGSVGVVVTDPPYGDTSLGWDVPVADWLAPVRPLLRPGGSVWCFGSLRMFMTQAGEFRGWRVAQDVVWEKHNGSSPFADRFRRVHEHVVQLYPADRRWSEVYKHPVATQDATRRTVRRKQRPAHWGAIGERRYESHDGGPRLMRSVIRVRSCHGHAEHPTQKPLGVLTPLIVYSAPPGALVVDPFAGSGSTLIAAAHLGRRAVGIELEEHWCEVAAMRLDATVPGDEAGRDGQVIG